MSTAVQLRADTPSYPLPKPGAARHQAAWVLRNHPGVWFLLGTAGQTGTGKTFSWQIRNGAKGWSMFGEGFEAISRTMFGEYRLYARWVDTEAVDS